MSTVVNYGLSCLSSYEQSYQTEREKYHIHAPLKTHGWKRFHKIHLWKLKIISFNKEI